MLAVVPSDSSRASEVNFQHRHVCIADPWACGGAWYTVVEFAWSRHSRLRCFNHGFFMGGLTHQAEGRSVR